MKIYPLILFLFSAVTLLGQPNYLAYHQQIQEAESLLLKEEFAAALESYEKVFEAYPFVFKRDYAIAFQVALVQGEKEKASLFLQRAIQGGLSWKATKSCKKVIKGHPTLSQQEIKDIYLKNRDSALKGRDEDLRAFVREMFKRDQKKALGNFIKVREKAKKKYSESKFGPHSNQQMAKLDSLLSLGKYPGEQLIQNGFWVSTIIGHHNSISEDFVKNDSLYLTLRPRLLTALKKGQMSPNELAIMDSWRHRVGRFEGPNLGILNPVKTETLNLTNRLRAEIGLPSVEHTNQLIAMEQESGMNLFVPGLGWWGEGIEIE